MSLQATLAWWVERVPMAAVATRISTLRHGLPLLPALAEHHCVGSSVPWRAGKPVIWLSSACSQAKLGLDLQAWIGGLLKGQPPTPGPKTLACGHAAP